jgi:hypothetical protein
MGSRWKQIAGPAIGLCAVVAALAILAGAPIVLFSEKNDLEAIPAPPAGSSEVAQVTASGAPATGSQGGPTGDLGGSARAGSASAGVAGSPSLTGSPTDGSPLARQPSESDGREASDDTPEGKGKSKPHGGKAKGHDKHHGNGHACGHGKSHGNGNAYGHGKSGGGGVASSGGTKHGHGAHSGTGKHSGRGHRAHARSRG